MPAAVAQVMLFRVIQEALQNCIKHAFSKNISIKIEPKENHFIICIQDDGRSFNVDLVKNKSLDLQNMQHRTQLLGGAIEWHSLESNRTNVSITISFENPLKTE